MKLKDVAGVSLSSKKETFGAKAILCFVLGVLLIIFAILSGRESSARFLPIILIAALFIILGIVLLFRKKSSLTVEITVKGEMQQALGLYANAGLALKVKKKSVKVKVNAEVANDIVTTLGSILLCD